jgi:hypothetical protein
VPVPPPGQEPAAPEPAPAQTVWPAGWYPDPDKEAPYRYYNGERWTDRRRDRKPLAAPDIAAAISALAVAIGALGPWITIGIISANGVDNGRDGVVTIIIAVVALLATYAHYSKGTSGWAVFTAICGAAIAVVGIIDVSDVLSRHGEILGRDFSPSVGWGLWLTVIAGVALFASAVVMIASQRRPG